MASYFDIIFYSLVGGLFSLIGGLVLLSKQSIAKQMAKFGTPFAAGALLAAVFVDLLPDGIEEGSPQPIFLAAMAGILLFFIAERFLRWFHHHHSDDKKTKDPSIPLIIAGDTIHNALDGVAIASAFLVSVPTGLVTTIAVAAHEIPQEIGDFGLLLSKGLSRAKVILVNVASALATTATAVITFALGSSEQLPIGILLGLSSGFLLYIALSDLIPTIHAKANDSKLLQAQTGMLLLGVVLVSLAVTALHGFVEPEHDSHDHGAETSSHSH